MLLEIRNSGLLCPQGARQPNGISIFFLLYGDQFYRNCSLIYLGISSKFQFTCMVQNFGLLPISWTHCASGYFVDPLSSILSPMFWKRLLNTVAFIVPVSSLSVKWQWLTLLFLLLSRRSWRVIWASRLCLAPRLFRPFPIPQVGKGNRDSHCCSLVDQFFPLVGESGVGWDRGWVGQRGLM